MVLQNLLNLGGYSLILIIWKHFCHSQFGPINVSLIPWPAYVQSNITHCMENLYVFSDISALKVFDPCKIGVDEQFTLKHLRFRI